MLKDLITLENFWKGLSHVTRWVIVPAVVLAIIVLGTLFVSDGQFSATMRSIVASFLFVFVAVTVLWLCSRWLDWLSKVRFKHDIAPLIRSTALSCSIYYTGRWLGLCLLVGTVLATVRF